jgi:hypothetical protein
MEQWEYLTKFCEASARSKEKRQFLKQTLNVRRPPAYTPESMIPELNALGRDGWELIHMEPVQRVNSKGKILFSPGWRWSNVYFCVFKRRRSVPQVMPVTAHGQPAFNGSGAASAPVTPQSAPIPAETRPVAAVDPGPQFPPNRGVISPED